MFYFTMSFKSFQVAVYYILLETVCGGKARDWMGPWNFLGGQIPIARQGQGLASVNKTKLIMFGGTNAFLGKI